MLLIGGLVIAAIVGVGYVAMSGSKAKPSVSPSHAGILFGSPAPSAVGTTTAPTPTSAVAAAGTVTFSPTSFSCPDTGGDITMTIWLAGTVPSSTNATAQMDGAVLNTDTVANGFQKQPDGRWLSSGTESQSTLCGSLGAGKHVVQVVDDKGTILAIGSFAITAGATPTPAGQGTVTIDPGTFSCTAAGVQVTVTAYLPGSISSSATVTGQLDGNDANTDTVGNSFDKQADGRWMSVATEAASSLCGSLSSGPHTLGIVDVDGNVLALGTFTLLP
jgi:hypothetical protein